MGPCAANARRPTVDSRCRGTTLFHSIVLFQTTRPKKKDRSTENTKTHSKTIKTQKTYIHIYTTRSDFTKALLLALQRAASDFLALIIKVSKLGKPVKGSILVTL